MPLTPERVHIDRKWPKEAAERTAALISKKRSKINKHGSFIISSDVSFRKINSTPLGFEFNLLLFSPHIAKQRC